jgi:hypothetical protein
MVTTYLSYDLVTRNLPQSLSRVAKQTDVARDSQYYKDNIGKIKTVDDFVNDYRLFSYAMTAYGLEDMIYAKAFMKKVLESDLSDANSYANRLADERYRDFAAAFNFGGVGGTAVAQSSAQMDDLIGLYDQTVKTVEDTVSEETRYFKVMMGEAGNVKNVDQFLQNDRLRNLMFTTYGIDGTYYNYSVIKGVLTSDPNDPNSYYNTVFGTKLEQYPAQYNAAKQEDADLQNRQTIIGEIPKAEESLALGQEAKADAEAEIAELEAQLSDPDSGVDPEETQAKLDAKRKELADIEEALVSVQEGLDGYRETLEELNAKLVPVEQTDARRAELATLMNNLGPQITYAEKMKALAEDFQFNADGSAPADGALTEEKLESILASYFSKQSRETNAEAIFNQQYFEKKIATVTNVSEIVNDPILYDYIRAAFDLNEVYIVKSTIEQILMNYNGIVEEYAETRPQYKELYEAFNFAADGTVAAGQALKPEALNSVRSNYYSRYDDKQDEAHDKAYSLYKQGMAAVKTLDDFLGTKAVYTFALQAVGIDPASISTIKLKKVLTSDLSDPKSYVYQLKDERLLTLARTFNFNAKGQITPPALAQSTATITNVGKEYILRETRFLKGDALEAAKKKAEEESKYYTSAMQALDNRDQLLKDRRLMDILLTAKGIDPTTVTDDFLKKAFTSDLDDPESFVNTLEDKRFAQMVGSFNFDKDGNVSRAASAQVQNAGEVLATESAYLRQVLETQQGGENAGVRLALYFQRMADSITDPYVIIGDDALLEFFRITFSLPAEISNMDVDRQAKVVEKYLNLEDLSDPEKLDKLVKRFTMMYDLENNVATSPALGILTGGGGSVGISADTLWALSQVRSG